VHLYDAAGAGIAEFPTDTVVIVISRSGRSVEIVKLLAKARACGAIVIAITTSPEGPLARGSQIPIAIPIELDHAILSTRILHWPRLLEFSQALLSEHGVQACCRTIRFIRKDQLRHFGLANAGCRCGMACTGGGYLFLARGCSTGSCQEARLLWEKA